MNKMGRLQKEMYSFAVKYSGWFSISKDAATRRVAISLINRKILKTNQHGQIRLTDIAKENTR